MITPTPLPDLAAAEFRRRQTRAREVVRNRGMGVVTAEAHLRPWLAIACLCAADLPELAPLLAELATACVGAGGPPLSPAAIRWLAAAEVCPRPRWVPLLAEARDLAFDRLPIDGSPAAVASAAALHRIATALRYDVNGCHIPDYVSRVASGRGASAERSHLESRAA